MLHVLYIKVIKLMHLKSQLTFVVPSLKKVSVIVTFIFSLLLDNTYPGANVIVMLSCLENIKKFSAIKLQSTVP